MKKSGEKQPVRRGVVPRIALPRQCSNKKDVMLLDSIEELFEGKAVDYPRLKQVNVTFKRAGPVRDKAEPHLGLPFEE